MIVRYEGMKYSMSHRSTCAFVRREAASAFLLDSVVAESADERGRGVRGWQAASNKSENKQQLNYFISRLSTLTTFLLDGREKCSFEAELVDEATLIG